MDKFRHTFQNFVIIENKIWFSSSVMNGIFCADIDGGYAKPIAVFPEDELIQSRLYTGIYAYGDCLIFIPYNAEKFCIYNMTKKSFTYLKPPIDKLRRKGSIYITTQWNEKIIMFNDYMKDMVILNTNDFTFEYYPVPSRLRGKKSRFWGMSCIVDDCAYMVVENLLVIIYLDRNEVVLREIGERGMQFNVIVCDNNQFWITDCENQLYSYHLGEENAKHELELIKSQVECDLPLVYAAVCVDNYMWIFFHKIEYILRVNVITMERKVFPFKEWDRKHRHMEYKYLDTQQQEIRILLRGEDWHRILDISSGTWRWRSYETSFEELADMYRGHSVQFESRGSEIGNGLKVIKVCLALQERVKASDTSNNCGKEIYRKLQ